MEDLSRPQSSVLRDPRSFACKGFLVFEILTGWCPRRIAGQEAEDENRNEEEDDRVNGELEGEHGETVQLLVHR